METIKYRSDNLFHKIHSYEKRPSIRTCMPKPDIENKCITRSKGGYIPFSNIGLKF